MNLENSDYRAMMFYDYKIGLKPQDSHNRLTAAFNNNAPAIQTVYKWFKEFRCGRSSLEDGDRSGRPQTATTAVQEDAVAALIKEDGRISLERLSDLVGISKGSVYEIIHNRLKLSKVSARWVPHKLNDEEKMNRVEWCQATIRRYRNGNPRYTGSIITGDESWIYCYDPESKQQSMEWKSSGQPPPQKFARSRSQARKMVATFVSVHGHISTVPVENNATVTSHWYTTTCLPTVMNAAPMKGVRLPIILHHDNAPAHRAQNTTFWLANHDVQLLQHPPYSPDLAPCDFFVFPKVKKVLRGQIFNNENEAVQAFIKEVDSISPEEWQICFTKWFERMHKCISCNGEYFEKL